MANSRRFFIRVDWETQAVNFYHQQTAEANEKVVLRNAKETAKTFRTIKEVFTEIAWAKHLQYENLEVLRKEVVEELINSDKSFLEIKKRYF